MASSVTTAVATRIPNDQARQIRQLAHQFGLTPSKTLAVIVARGLNEQRRNA